MSSSPTNVRFSDELDERVAKRARQLSASKSKVIVTAVDEWLKAQEHPGIKFVTVNTGERRAKLLVGPEVWTVAEAWQQHDDESRTSAEVSEVLGLSIAEVEAALAYWADYREEIDHLIELHHEAQDAALAAWERRQEIA